MPAETFKQGCASKCKQGVWMWAPVLLRMTMVPTWASAVGRQQREFSAAPRQGGISSSSSSQFSQCNQSESLGMQQKSQGEAASMWWQFVCLKANVLTQSPFIKAECWFPLLLSHRHAVCSSPSSAWPLGQTQTSVYIPCPGQEPCAPFWEEGKDKERINLSKNLLMSCWKRLS